MNELVSVDTIIGFLKDQVEQKNPIPPSLWLDAASKLNVLLGDETDELYKREQRVAQMKVDFLRADPKGNVSKAKALVEASDEYREMRQQDAKIKRIEEHIKLAKYQSRMRDNEFRLS